MSELKVNDRVRILEYPKNPENRGTVGTITRGPFQVDLGTGGVRANDPSLPSTSSQRHY